MKRTPQGADERLLQTLGERLARRRLAKNLTQARLAEEAGIGIRTLQRLEGGEADARLSGLAAVCRVLGLTARLEALVPEEAPSPMELLALQGGARMRASKRSSRDRAPKKWTWGDAP